MYFMSTACERSQGEGVWLTWTHVDKGRGSKIQFVCGRHKWMAPSQQLNIVLVLRFYILLDCSDNFHCLCNGPKLQLSQLGP